MRNLEEILFPNFIFFINYKWKSNEEEIYVSIDAIDEPLKKNP